LSPKNSRMTIIKFEPKGLRNFITVHMQQYPFIFSDERRYRIRRHLAFWVFWWIFQGFLYSFSPFPWKYFNYGDRLAIAMLDSILYLPAHIFLACSLMYFVIPVYLTKGKYVKAGLSVISLFLLTAFFASSIGKYVIGPVRSVILPFATEIPHPDPRQTLFLSLLAGLRGAIMVGGIAAAIKLMKYWYLKEQRNLQLEKENAETQLQLLKAQVHPHFLFNTLNNIYSYTQKTSPVATKLVSGLSDLLRFMLYESNQPTVLLSKELRMVQDYISLEQIRYGNKLELHIDLPENTHELQIAPLLLLPLVENCFKHGTSNILEHPWINLQVTLHGNQMQMKLLNGKLNNKDEPSKPGIGIQNVRQRLELLYPGKHEIAITDAGDVFIVNLKLELEQKKETVRTVFNKVVTHA
jgi:hypothetical protein